MRGSTVKNRRSNNIVEQAVNHAVMCRSDCQPLRPDAALCCSNNEHQSLPITPANSRHSNVSLVIPKNSEQYGYYVGIFLNEQLRSTRYFLPS